MTNVKSHQSLSSLGFLTAWEKKVKRPVVTSVRPRLLKQSLFGNKPTGFGATTTSTPSFGTSSSLFGNKPALTLGTGANTSAFGKGRGRGVTPVLTLIRW